MFKFIKQWVTRIFQKRKKVYFSKLAKLDAGAGFYTRKPLPKVGMYSTIILRVDSLYAAQSKESIVKTLNKYRVIKHITLEDYDAIDYYLVSYSPYLDVVGLNTYFESVSKSVFARGCEKC